MANYVGYFRSLEMDHLYSVKLIGDTASTSYTEIKLAAEQPFVVTYQESETPFDPVRKSNAVIRIVHTDYLEDILSPYAQATQVILTDETTSTIEWMGFLTPKVFDADYVTCPYEDFELEAADCISSLQYIDFQEAVSGTPQLVTINSILGQICDACQILDGYYWTRSKRIGGTLTILMPTVLKISERNFFTNDTEEPWKLSEVLEEICKYLGFTAMQWKNYIYFVDYQYFHSNDRLYMTKFLKSNDYAQGAVSYLDTAFTLTQDAVRGANHTISYEPVYNKIVVKDNFYNIEEIIPNMFDDQYLTNRNGDFYANYEVEPEQWEEGFEHTSGYDYVGCYPYGSQALGIGQGYKWERAEDKYYNTDTKEVKEYYWRYFKRNYDHKYWKSLYYNEGGSTAIDLTDAELSGNTCMRDYVGGTICDMGVVEKNHVSDYSQYAVPNKLDYDRYLCMCLKNVYGQGDVPLIKLQDYALSTILPEDSYIVLYFTALYERHVNKAYICPDWNTESCKSNAFYIGEIRAGGAAPRLKLKIGDKYWDGQAWVSQESVFRVAMERTSDQHDVWNTEMSTLNNISWDMYVNEEGYKIPLSGVSLADGIEFEILRPSKNWYKQYPSENDYVWKWNAYYWIKNFSVKVVTANQDKEREDSDVIYENIIDADAISTLNEIELKITTDTDMISPSWSNMVLYTGGTNTLLSTITETNLSNTAQKPEENIIEKYYMEYSTPTAKFNWVTQIDAITPFTKVYAAKVDAPSEGYCQLGTEIDYKDYKQNVKLVHLK